MTEKSDTVRMKHRVFEGDSTFYFYEGECPVKKGIITVPKDKPHWIQRAWMKGYDRDPKTGETLALSDILA